MPMNFETWESFKKLRHYSYASKSLGADCQSTDRQCVLQLSLGDNLLDNCAFSNDSDKE